MRVNLYYFVCPVCKKYFISLNEYQMVVIAKYHYESHGIHKTEDEIRKEVKVKTLNVR